MTGYERCSHIWTPACLPTTFERAGKTGENLDRALLSSALTAAVIAVLALPALVRPGKRFWYPILVAIAFLDGFATALPAFDHTYSFFKSDWNWSGKILDLGFLALTCLVLMASRKFAARDLGLTIRQGPGIGPVLLVAVVPFLLLIGLMTWSMSARGAPPDSDTILFQLTAPSLTEELAYRGILLALFDRIFTGRVRIMGASIGFGVFATAIAFGAGHGIAVGKDLNVHTYVMPMIFTGAIGLFLAWLRARAQSLVLPMAVHSAVNLIYIFAPVFR